MPFDYTRIRRGEMIAAIGALVLIVVMFLPWYSFKGDNRARYLLGTSGKLPLTGTAWHVYSNTSILFLLLIVVAVALSVLTATGRRVDFPLAGAATALGVLTVLVAIDKLFINLPGGSQFSQSAYGGYLGLLAIIVITVGAALTAREDGWRPARHAPAVETGDPAGGGPAVPIGDSTPAREASPRREE